jgi:microcin C transport system substrate-binding protein
MRFRVQAFDKCWLRRLALLLAIALSAFCHAAKAKAEKTIGGEWLHAISLTGQPKYGPGFRFPDYVNPLAPQGGRVRLGALGTFDNFNPLVSGVKGNLAAHLMQIYEPLLAVSLDEPTTEYGLLAEAVAFPDDFSSVSFRLRPEARWHDGTPVTADDVLFSAEAWKRLSPQWNKLLLKVANVEKLSDLEIRFTFSEKGDPALPLYIGQMSILPRHWWTGTDAAGRRRDITQTTLEPPLGSGPYKLRSFIAGRSVSYEHVPDYWGKAVPIRVGTSNLDRVDIEYFRDANVMLEAFKADLIDVRRETSLKSWVVGYDFAAADQGRVVRDAFGIERLGIVKAFVFNLRQKKLQDPRLRQALAMAYGFDDVNRNVFHNMLSRPGSYFPHTDFAAAGPLSDDEKALLARLPEAPSAARLEAAAPLSAQPTDRASLFNALELLREAGYTLKDGRLLDKAGKRLSLEFVLEDAAMERVAAAYASQLAKLGIATNIRVVDDVQYQNRLRSFDFDIAVHAWVQGHAPGGEQREYWTTASADKRGANNLGGLKDPLVDALVEQLVLAESRSGKIAAGRLLDRVLRLNWIGVPILNEDKEYVARWDRFGRPAVMPRYGATAFPSIWWWDAEKAQKTGGRNP